MASFGDRWGRPVAHNVIATGICGGAAFAGGKAASVTPALQAYAPFSYILGALVCLLITGLFLRFLPSFRKSNQRSADGVDLVPPPVYDDTQLRERISGLAANLEADRHRTAELNDNLSKLESRLSELNGRIVNLSLLDRLESWEKTASKYVDAVEMRWGNIERMVHDTKHPHGSRAWEDAKEQFALYLRDLESEISKGTKREIRLRDTPKFAENQLVRFPGDDKASDEAKRIDYNRLYEMKQGAVEALKSLRNRIISQRKNLESIHGYLSLEEEIGTGRDFRP